METADKRITYCFPGIQDGYEKFIDKLLVNHREEFLQLSDQIKKCNQIDVEKYLINREETNLLTKWVSNYMCDYLVSCILMNNGIKPDMIMGYSMGLITGAVCSGAFRFEDGIHLLDQIIKYRKLNFREEMVTVIGLEEKDIQSVICEQELDEDIFIACYNNDICYGLSGKEETILKLIPKLYEYGAIKVKIINSPFAFHSAFMKPNIEQLEEYVLTLCISKPQVPILSLIDQKILCSAEDVRKELVRNMYSRMFWSKSVEMLSKDTDTFVDIGLLKGLYKMSKGVYDQKEFLSVDSFDIFNTGKRSR